MKESALFEKKLNMQEQDTQEMQEKISFESEQQERVGLEEIKKDEDDKVKKKMEKVRGDLNSMNENEQSDDGEKQKIREEKKQKYIDKYLPEYVNTGESSMIYKAFRGMSKLALKDVQGKEKLPEAAKLFIANHRGGESGRLMAALDDPVHIASAEKINWDNDKSGAFKWLMKKLGMVPVRESFSHLDDVQKKRVIEKSRTSEKDAHEKAAENVKSLGGGNKENIRAMVALLLSGEDVAIFTEGAFSRLEEDERKSYAGYALIAREYKRITGGDLDIVPTGIRNNKVRFDDPIHIDQGGRQSREELEDLATEKIHDLYGSLEK